MADSHEMRPRGSVDFVEASVLDLIIPEATDLSIEEALAGSAEKLDDERDSPLSAIPQRNALFFDETINVYIILQTPYLDEDALRSYLGRLDITLEAQAVNSQAENGDGKPNFEIIHSGSVSDSEDPLIIVQVSEEDEAPDASGRVLIVWKTSITLAKPQRLRLQSPSMVIAASANLKASDQATLNIKKDEYMPSLIPSALNLLESFNEDAVIGPAKPRLSALRVSRVVPTQMGKETRLLKDISRKSLKIYPAIGSRVRFMRPSNNSPGNLAMLVSLDVDITPYVSCPVVLEKISLDLPGGIIEDLNQLQGLSLPLECLPRDDVTFIYRVTPDELDFPKTNVKHLDIHITGKVKLSEFSQPTISMNWKAVVDFTLPVNPGYGPPSQAIQRRHRPSQLSLGSTFEIPTAGNAQDQVAPNETPARQERTMTIPDFGVTMTFRCVTDHVVAGKVFTWEVFVVNRSERSRRLALVVVPRRRRTEARISRPPSSGYGRKDIAVADAVVDENVLYAMQKSSSMEAVEVVCLSSDIRIGPLSPAACHTEEIKFIALHVGIAQLDAIRIVDLGSNEHVDIKDLPTINVAP